MIQPGSAVRSVAEELMHDMVPANTYSEGSVGGASAPAGPV
jgi:hypothetical protein